MREIDYRVNGVPLDKIRNRTESSVLAAMPTILAEHPDWTPDYLDIQDIYALALNRLPPRYAQPETIIIRKGGNEEHQQLLQILREAVTQVRGHPHH
jgi:hypothetical protein